MSDSRQVLGKAGEELALEHIKQAGLSILECNYRCPIGEMDIIARDGKMIVFLEVRTRSSGKRGWGEESITAKKKARLYRIATHYLKFNNYREWPPIRFDLIAIRAQDKVDGIPGILWVRGI